MIILGINFGHNSSICLIIDNKIIAAIEEEKISRIKNDFFWPCNAIDRVLAEYKIDKSDVDIISIQDDTSNLLGKFNIKFRITRNKFYLILDFIFRALSYFKMIKTVPFYNNESFKKIIHQLGFSNANIQFHDHHLSHAASAFYTAPFISDLVITCDGFGGFDSFNFYSPSKNGLNLIKANSYKISIGQFYSMITSLLGFKPNRHEGKITGLAAFGKETILINKFKSLWRYNNDNNLERFPFDDFESINYLKNTLNKLSLRKRINLMEAGNNILNNYTFNNEIILEFLKNETRGFSNEDIAYACQKVSEEIILDEIKKIHKKNFANNKLKLSLAGGVFANVRINQLIYELDFVENIFVQPAMTDAGLAMGNAILSSLSTKNNDGLNLNNFMINNTYLGPDYTKDLDIFIKQFDNSKIEFRKMTNKSDEIAQLLYDNKIIGFWSNRMEWGPRALGARSILLNTFDKSVNDSLNKRLNRTEFMPFAPVVLDSIAKKYFPKYDINVPAAKYMTITYDTEKSYHDMLQAVVHVDGTARPQVISKEDNDYYYKILRSFYKISGCAALVNTSFNAHEEPILSNPYTAINALLTNRIDYLVMEEYIFNMKSD